MRGSSSTGILAMRVAALLGLAGLPACVSGRDSVIAMADAPVPAFQDGSSIVRLDPDAIIVGGPAHSDPGRVLISSAGNTGVLGQSTGQALPASLIYASGNVMLSGGATPLAAVAIDGPQPIKAPRLSAGLSAGAVGGPPIAPISPSVVEPAAPGGAAEPPAFHLSGPGEGVQVASAAPVLGGTSAASLSPGGSAPTTTGGRASGVTAGLVRLPAAVGAGGVTPVPLAPGH